MNNFKIPRLASIADRVRSRAKGKDSRKSMLERPLYLGDMSYRSRTVMSAGRTKRSRTPDSDSDFSSDDGEISDASRSGSDGDVSDKGENRGLDKSVDDDDPLKDFFSEQKRVDAKDVTLSLLPSTLKHYFSTVLRDGELSKEGREELADKYYLSPEQYEKFKPPRLDDTKLFRLADHEFRVSRAGRLVAIHTK